VPPYTDTAHGGKDGLALEGGARQEGLLPQVFVRQVYGALTAGPEQSWRRRWFVLKPNERALLYYKKEEEHALGKVLPKATLFPHKEPNTLQTRAQSCLLAWLTCTATLLRQ